MFGGTCLPGRGHSIHKGLGAGLCLVCWRNSEAASLGAEWEKGERGRKGRLGRGRVWVAGVKGCKRTQAFTQEGGSPGGLWAEESAVPDSGAHTLPLVAGAGKTDYGGEGGSCRWCSQAPSGGFLGRTECGMREAGGVQGGGPFTGPSE